jgi:gliding motility-associated-like protein
MNVLKCFLIFGIFNLLMSNWSAAQAASAQSRPLFSALLPPCSQLNLPDSLFFCSGENIQLIADLSQFESYSSLQWSGGNGTFIPSDTVAQPIYVPSTQEVATGVINLTLQVFTTPINQPGGSFLAYDHSGEDIIFYTNTQDGSVDTIQSNTGNDWTAMGFRTADNMLYGISNIVTTPTLSSVNVETGVVTSIYTYPDKQFYAGDYDNVNEVFYVVGIDEGNTSGPLDEILYSVDLNNGSLTTIGNLNTTALDNFFYSEGINGLAYDPSLNVLWAISDGGNLMQIDPANAAVISTTASVEALRGLAYDYNENELWGISAMGTLYHINKFTGEMIEVVFCQEQLFYVTSLTYAIPQNALDNICSDNTTIVINNPTPPDLGADITLCEGETITLSAPGFVVYEWQDGSSTTTYIVTDAGTYSVEVTDDFGCVSSDAITVNYNNTPNANFTATPPTAIITDTEIYFTVSNPDNDYNYSWSFESGNPQASDDINPVVIFPTIPGNYEVMLVVSNAIGCADTTTYTVIIESDGTISLPNIFTPNGDGDNDTFVPFQSYPGEWQLTIYNRWGVEVYSTANIRQGWTGQDHTEGTYYWILEPQAGQSGVNKAGFVTLVR